MSNRALLLYEMSKALESYGSKLLSLSGLVNRLEELSEALSDGGIIWGVPIDEFLIQLEIINSLMLSGDRPELTADDVHDIDKYLMSIRSEINRQVPGDTRSLISEP